MAVSQEDVESGETPVCPVFLCYRQVDGGVAAEWLYTHLDFRQLADTEGNAARQNLMKLSLYFDQTAPMVEDWQAVHGPALQTSRAMILVTSPGIATEIDGNDWVYKEIHWWLKHRKTAPIIIDTTGEGARWVPRSIHKKWPNAQRIALISAEWERMSRAERASFEERTLDRIIQGIARSERESVDEDLAREQRISKRLRLAVGGVFGLLVLAVIATFVAYRQYREADNAKAEILEKTSDLEKTQSNLVKALGDAKTQQKVAEQAKKNAEEQTKRAVVGETSATEQTRIAEAERGRAVSEANRAELRSRIAEARRLAAEALNAVSLYPQLALLLAVESVQAVKGGVESIEPSAETALRSVLAVTEGSVACRVGTPIWRFAIATDGNRAVVSAMGQPGLQVFRLDRPEDAPIAMKGSAGILAPVVDPRGEFVAAVSGSSVMLWKVKNPELAPIQLSEEGGRLSNLSFLPNSRRLVALRSSFDPATSAANSALQVWDLDKPAGVLTRYEEEPGFVSGFAISSNRDVVATVVNTFSALPTAPGTADKTTSTVRVWELGETAGSPRVFGPIAGMVTQALVHPDGRAIAVLKPNQIQVYRLDEPDAGPISLAMPESSIAERVAYHPRENRLLVAQSDRQPAFSDSSTGSVNMWDLDHSTEVPTRLLNTVGNVREMIVHPNGRDLVVASTERSGYARLVRSMALIDLAQLEAQPVMLRGHEGHITEVAFHPDGRRMVSAGTDGTLRYWDLRQPRTEPRMLGQHAKGIFSSSMDMLGQQQPSVSSITALQVDPTGRWVSTLDVKGTLRLWELERTEARPVGQQQMAGQPPFIGGTVAFSKGQSAVNISVSQDVWAWNIATASKTGLVPLLHLEKRPTIFKLRPDGGRVLATGFDYAAASGPEAPGWLEVWALDDTQRTPRSLIKTTPKETIYRAEYHRNGKRIITVGSELPARLGVAGKSWLRVWDTDRPESSVAAIPIATGLYDDLKLDPSGRWLTLADWRGVGDDARFAVTLFDLDHPELTPTELVEMDGRHAATAFLPDGRRLLIASADGRIIVCDLLHPLHHSSRFSLNEVSVTHIVVHPDGRRLITATADGTIYSRELDRPETVGTAFHGHLGPVSELLLHPDGKRLISAGTDGLLLVWDLELKPLLVLAGERAGRNLSRAEWRRFFSDQPYRKTFMHLPEAPSRDAAE